MQIVPVSMTNQYRTKLNCSNFRKENVSNVVSNNQPALNFKAKPELTVEILKKSSQVMKSALEQGKTEIVEKVMKEIFPQISSKKLSDKRAKERLTILGALAAPLGITFSKSANKTNEVKTVNSAQKVIPKETKTNEKQLEYASPEEFAKYGLKVTNVDEKDGLYTIEHLCYNRITDSHQEFLKKHFHQIKRIEENASFSNLDITSLENLEEIGGDAYFMDSEIQSLGKLEEIGGDAYFMDSEIQSLGKLEEIGGDAYFMYSKVISLGELKRISGDAYFMDSEIRSLGKLEEIGGVAYFGDLRLRSLNKLKEIGGGIYCTSAMYRDFFEGPAPIG